MLGSPLEEGRPYGVLVKKKLSWTCVTRNKNRGKPSYRTRSRLIDLELVRRILRDRHLIVPFSTFRNRACDDIHDLPLLIRHIRLNDDISHASRSLFV